MPQPRTLLALATLLLGAGGASATDLTTIERTLGKEPKYAGKPKYCLLVFGPEAKLRVWVVQDGNVFYVDRNGNGDLTEPGEKVEPPGSPGGDVGTVQLGDIRDGAMTHKNLSIMRFPVTAETVGNDQEYQRITRDNPARQTWWVSVNAERASPAGDKLPPRVSYIANGDGQGYLVFAARPAEAPIIHFNGPWTLGLQDIKQQFVSGQKTELQIGVGTPGVGPGTFAFVLYPGLIPDKAYPVAEITFPAPTGGAVGPPQRFTLTKRC